MLRFPRAVRTLRTPAVWILLLGLLACEGPPAQAAPLTGKVFNQAGQPVAGAKVWMSIWGKDGPQREKTGVSGEDGAFVIEPLPGLAAGDLGKTWAVMLCAYKPGRALDGMDVSAPDQTIVLTLSPPDATTGTILGADGKPLAGATVAPTAVDVGQWDQPGHRRFMCPGSASQELAVQTDAAGQFTLRLGPAGSHLDLQVTAPGYGSALLWAGTDLNPVRLAKAGILRVHLTCVDKTVPLAGLHFNTDYQPTSGQRLRGETTLQTDAQGQAVSEAPPGTYTVCLGKQPADAYFFRGKAGVQVKSGEETVVELVAEKAAPVRGRVVADDTGQGMPDATVELISPDGGNAVVGQSGADGAFSFSSLLGKINVHIDSPNDGKYLSTGVALSGREVTAAGLDLGEVRLLRAQHVAFLALDEAGRPVAGALVKVDGQQHWTPRGQVVVSDAQGRGELSDLEAKTYTLQAETATMGSEEVKVDAGKVTDPVRLTMKVLPVCSATVVVLDQDGVPFPQAQASLYEQTAQAGRSVPGPTPDATGRVTWTGLKVGAKYRLIVTSGSAFPCRGQERTAAAGQTQDLGSVRLTRLHASVAGTVVDGNGKPVAGARVWDNGGAPQVVETLCDAEGRFKLEGLGEGYLFLFAEAKDLPPVGIPARAGQTDVHIVLRPNAPPTMGPPIPPPNPIVDPAEGRALALDLLKQAVELTRGLRDQWGNYRSALLGALAQRDPEAAIAAAVPGTDDMAALDVALGIEVFPRDAEKGRALIKQGKPSSAFYDLLRAADACRSTDPDLAKRYVSEAESARGGIVDTLQSLQMAAMVIQRWRSLGDPRAEVLTRQVYETAVGLPVIGAAISARAEIASEMAPLDPDGALALLTPIAATKASERQAVARAKDDLAAALASKDPDRALAMVANNPDDTWVEDGPWKIAVALAAHQTAKARQIAAGITESYRRAPLQVALTALVPDDQVPALIQEARESLVLMARRIAGDPRGWQGLAALACIARARGYTGYRDLALLAASMRTPPTATWQIAQDNSRDDLQLALLLTYTAPESARGLLESAILASGGEKSLANFPLDVGLRVAAELDMKQALRLWGPHGGDPGHWPYYAPGAYDVSSLVDVLTRPVADRERDALERAGFRWPTAGGQ